MSDPVSPLSLFSGLGLLIGLPSAFVLNNRLLKEQPSVQPFKWGYYISVAGAIPYIFFTFALWWGVIFGSRDNKYEVLGMLIMAMLLTAASSVFSYMIQRKKWAWVVGTILILNPVVWIINAIYIKNRWDEL